MNAIKFTASGRIDLEFVLVDPGHWAIRVTDTGRGISPANQARIFREFERLDAGDVPGLDSD
jgi:signal transduction histidine kinase